VELSKLATAKYEMAAALIVGGLVLALAFGAGWKVNGYKLDSSYGKTIAVKDKEISDLKVAIEKQNGSVNVLGAEKEAAVKAAEAAKKYAKDVTEISKKRVTKADEIEARDCRSMIEKLKGVYQDEKVTYSPFTLDYHFVYQL
jgi:hypothetical protein